MDTISPWLETGFRWIHVVAGVLWIGLLYFFNWVNAQVMPKLDGPTKHKLVPQLLPRTLFFFRWGAAYTWITGVLLLHLVYQQGMAVTDPGVEAGSQKWIAFAVVLIAPFIYDALWKAMAGKQQAGVAVSLALVVAAAYVFSEVLHLDARATTIHLGAMFGTIMAFNVWFRIWPTQRKIIAATAGGTPPDAGWAPHAGLRSKHNTYMSVPLIYTMVVQHNIVMAQYDWYGLAGVVAIGWLVTWMIYKKSATEGPTFF